MRRMWTAFFYLLVISCVSGDHYYGRLLSEDWGTGAAHGVAGAVYAVDDNTFQIVGFTYDGEAPDAFFYLGTDKSYDGSISEDTTADIINNPRGNREPLQSYDGETVVLKLPKGKNITDYTYISIWCRKFTVYFGGIDIPQNFMAPKPQMIGSLSSYSHETTSGQITIINDRTIEIKNFAYDGEGPDAYFYVGIGTTVVKQSPPYGVIPNEKGSSAILKAYTGKDIVLTLPASLSFTHIKWLSIWCVEFDANFADIFFPENLNIPPHVASLVNEDVYYGKLISENWGANAAHALAGATYVVDENTFQIIGFTYDGIAPDAFFYLGTDKSYDGSIAEDATADIINNPRGNRDPLQSYESETVVLKLPLGKKITDYTYISIWCREFAVYFGGFNIPQNLVAPKPQTIGQLNTHAHEATSGEITILNDKTIQIKNFAYDGTGPDAYFYVGIGDTVEMQPPPYGKIPDENGSSKILKAYTGKDIVLSLPGSLSFNNIKWLSVWCVEFDANFADIFLPAKLDIPPSLDSSINRKSMNCESLSDNLQISWLVTDNSILFELAGSIDRNTDYMAFGLSGSDTSFKMINSDVVVTYWKEDGAPTAQDYFITAYAQCAGNGGACPDTSDSNNSTNNIQSPAGEITDGIVRIRYKRSLDTADHKDIPYIGDGSASQQIVWAIGPLNPLDETGKHYAGGRITVAKAINFGRAVYNDCPSFVPEKIVEKPDFSAHHLYGTEDNTVFTAEIGPSGSTQGYLALTGSPSWGIAWYINGILIPELHLKRGVSYTFRVGAGTDPAVGAKYHPFYFTDSVEGGFAQVQGSTEKIYNGKVNGQNANKAVGGYCEYEFTKAAKKATANGKVYQCFEELQKDLILKCDEGDYTEFVWTPDTSTPDLLYYQCYTHRSLGWKVHVYNELPAKQIPFDDCTNDSTPVSVTVSMFTLLLSAVMARFL